MNAYEFHVYCNLLILNYYLVRQCSLLFTLI